MKKRSITDEEISIIKNMISRGMKNKDIQFYFNRPERSVNNGRITGIKNGTYSNSSEIEAASDEMTDAYIQEIENKNSGKNTYEYDPLSNSRLKYLFKKNGKNWTLKLGETDEHECKTNFGFKHGHTWLKTVAGLANNKGGYIFFGIQDKNDHGENIVQGVNSKEFVEADQAEFSKRLRSLFDPTPQIKTAIFEIGNKKIGIIYVYRHESRPIICVKNEGDIKEGDILFRYPGQTARIKYSDLRTILDHRDEVSREKILPLVEKLLSLGPERAMIADLQEGALFDQGRTIKIDEELAKKLIFIKEGDFSEKEGAPALRLIGNVETTSADDNVSEKGIITRSDLINGFIDQKNPSNPAMYIRFALESPNTAWLPIQYYANLANLNKEEVIDLIKRTQSTTKRKKLFIDRISKKSTAYKKNVGTPARILSSIYNNKKVPEVRSVKDARQVGMAIQGVVKKSDIELNLLLKILKLCVDRAGADSGSASLVRRGICRVDELFFGSD